MFIDVLKKQFSGDEQLPPVNYHVTENIVTFDDQRCMFIARCSGLPFEVTSDGVLDNQYDELNNLMMSMGKSMGGRLALWLYVDHYKTSFDADYSYQFDWMNNFGSGYLNKFKSTDTYENKFYLALIIKPGPNDDLDDCISELNEVQIQVSQVLRSYECEILSMYETNGHQFSQVYEFLSYLYNGFWERVPVTARPAREVISTSHLHFSYRILETKHPDRGHHFSSFFDLKDFPAVTRRGINNPMLSLNFHFILCYSFAFINSADSIRLINQVINKMQSAGDDAGEQLEELKAGKGAIMSGETYFGEMHGAMVVFADTTKKLEENGAVARTTMSASCASLYVPANISAPETFFSLFPGNLKRRPRVMPKTTRNMMGLFSMNSYSSGKQSGNPIGDGSAVMPLFTSVKSVYHFNFHYSIPEIDARGEKVAGHTCILGATGVGKTTLQTTLLAFLQRFNPKLFAIDKDGSMRGFIEAFGGSYFTINDGVPTGLNPFQLPDDLYNRSFLYDLVMACGKRPDWTPAAEDMKDVKRAVDNVFELPFEQRRFGVLLHSMPDRGPDCLARRLSEWCYTEIDGRYAYALDNPTNSFNWNEFNIVGFDVSDFLTVGHPATEPILSYLFHLKSLMSKKKGVLVTVIEEFWLPLKYPTTSAQIMDILKTGRRRDEFAVLVTQSPEDVIQSDMLPTVLQQTPTKIYLPNPDAEFTNASGGGYSRFGLSQKEFDRLKSLGLQSRSFLIKQGAQCSIARLDLSDLEQNIAVLAMAQDDFQVLEQTKSAMGENPDDWVPAFITKRATRFN